MSLLCKVQSTEAKCSQAPIDLDSSEIPKELIEAVVDVGRHKWWELGRSLGITIPALCEYEEKRASLERRAVEVIHDWQRDKGDLATVGCLLEACDKAKVGGDVRKQVRKKYGLVLN